jgi:hypothetical protein
MNPTNSPAIRTSRTSRRESVMKRLYAGLVLGLLLSAPAGATSVSNVKINRLGVNATAFVTLTTTVAPSAGCRTSSTEYYTFDAGTDKGRAQLMTALVAYSTQSLVNISGTGTCSLVNGFQVENVSSLTIF